MNENIAFIGGGNMARSLIGGLVAQGRAPATIRVAEPVAALRDALQADFGVSVFAHGVDAVESASAWVLATKPQVLRAVCEDLSQQAQASRPLIVSIAAGITATQLERWLGGHVAVVRTMPNTPALLGAGDGNALEKHDDLLELAPSGPLEPFRIAHSGKHSHAYGNFDIAWQTWITSTFLVASSRGIPCASADQRCRKMNR